RIQSPILCKDKRIPVEGVGAYPCHHVDGASGGPAGFSREPCVDDLKLLDRFERELRAAGSQVLVVVIEPINRDVVAPSAETAEGKAAVGQRGERLLCGLL